MAITGLSFAIVNGVSFILLLATFYFIRRCKIYDNFIKEHNLTEEWNKYDDEHKPKVDGVEDEEY